MTNKSHAASYSIPVGTWNKSGSSYDAQYDEPGIKTLIDWTNKSSKHASLAQQRLAFLHSLLRLGKGIANLCTCLEECNKYDVTAVPCLEKILMGYISCYIARVEV
jgi:hypothetical protein